jgi:flagellar M-ring protein FliF
MDPEQVTLLDSRGKVLSRTSPSDATGKMTSTMMETQHSYERNLEERLQSLLDKAVGEGKSVARVNALLDFNQVEKFEEKYDPESAVVRSEQRSELKDSAATPAASGIPGVQSNMGKAAPTTAVNGSTKSKSDETLNYEVSRSSAKIIVPVGTLTKLSVAILVDGKYVTPPPGKDGKPVPAKYAPRSPEELQKLEALVKSAVGFSPDRGDQLTVENIPFQDTGDDVPLPAPKVWERPIFMDLMKNGLLGLGFLALMLIVVRPLVKSLTDSGKKPSGSFEPVYGEDGELQLEGGGHGKMPQLETVTISQQELLEVVRNDPYLTAQVVRNWMK